MLEWIKGEKVEVLLTQQQISERVKEMADKISQDFAGQPITLLATLKGSVFFLADLARQINATVDIDFIKASSYGDRTKSDGVVELEHFPDTKLAGKNVIVLEDIIDTGYTMKYLHKYLMEQGPKSMKLCTLLDKPSRREVEGLSCDYVGFTVPDEFLVGYGLDYAQRYRNLPYVGILHFEIVK